MVFRMNSREPIKPSQVTEVFWIPVTRKKGDYPKSTSKSGKWLVFVHDKKVDVLWVTIKKAVEDGKLGGSAKVSTNRPNPNALHPKLKVICVYTYDFTDVKDVMRIRRELRKLGVTSKICYKADEDTLKGRYRILGHEDICKYYE